MEADAILAKKATTGGMLKLMRNGPAYKSVLERIDERCGKFFHAWVNAEEDKAKVLREMAKGYFAFDALVMQMINEGDAAEKILQQKQGSTPSQPGEGA